MDQTVLIIGGYIENTTWASQGFVWFIVTLSMERNLKDVWLDWNRSTYFFFEEAPIRS